MHTRKVKNKKSKSRTFNTEKWLSMRSKSAGPPAWRLSQKSWGQSPISDEILSGGTSTDTSKEIRQVWSPLNKWFLFTLLTCSCLARLSCPVWTWQLAGVKFRPGWPWYSALPSRGDLLLTWWSGEQKCVVCCLFVAPIQSDFRLSKWVIGG
jgi:hypothetical protein